MCGVITHERMDEFDSDLGSRLEHGCEIFHASGERHARDQQIRNAEATKPS